MFAWPAHLGSARAKYTVITRIPSHALSRRATHLSDRVVYQFSWSPSIYCMNANGFTRSIN